MSSSLFSRANSQKNLGQRNNQFSTFGQIGSILKMLKTGNPQEIAETMIKQNPEFAKFYEANKNKSIEQMLQDNGVNIGDVMKLLK